MELPGIADQWMRLLPRHAFKGFARARRDRTASLHGLRLARNAEPLQCARARGARLGEAVTRLTNQGVPDEVYEEARAEFSDAELAQLTLSVVAINGWNRFNVAFRTPAGHYKSAVQKPAA